MPIPSTLSLSKKPSYGLHGGIPTGEHNPHIPEPLLTPQLPTCNQRPKLRVKQHDGKGHGGAGLHHDFHALEDKAHGAFDLVLADGVDGLDLVAVADDGPVGEADGRAQAVGDGEGPDVLDALARKHAAPPVVRPLEARLAPEDDRPRLVAEPGCRPAEQPAAAERRQDRVEGLLRSTGSTSTSTSTFVLRSCVLLLLLLLLVELLLELQRRGALPEDDVRVVVGGHEDGAFFLDDCRRHGLALRARRPAEDHVRRVQPRAGDLRRRTDLRHHDVRWDREGRGRERKCLCVVPWWLG